MKADGEKTSISFLLPVILFFIICSLFCINIQKNKNSIIPLEISKTKEIEIQKPAKNTEYVVFNPKSLKYHKSYCEWAVKCKRCIKIPKTEAKNKGGIPCKICGKN